MDENPQSFIDHCHHPWWSLKLFWNPSLLRVRVFLWRLSHQWTSPCLRWFLVFIYLLIYSYYYYIAFSHYFCTSSGSHHFLSYSFVYLWNSVSSATPVLYKKILFQHVASCACLLVVHVFLDYYFIFACLAFYSKQGTVIGHEQH